MISFLILLGLFLWICVPFFSDMLGWNYDPNMDVYNKYIQKELNKKYRGFH